MGDAWKFVELLKYEFFRHNGDQVRVTAIIRVPGTEIKRTADGGSHSLSVLNACESEPLKNVVTFAVLGGIRQQMGFMAEESAQVGNQLSDVVKTILNESYHMGLSIA